MIPSSLDQANTDPRVSPRAFKVYAWCLKTLDYAEERPVKILPLAFAVRLKKDTAIAALRELVALRYIAKGERPNGEPRRYRLLPAPALTHPQHKARAA